MAKKTKCKECADNKSRAQYFLGRIKALEMENANLRATIFNAGKSVESLLALAGRGPRQ